MPPRLLAALLAGCLSAFAASASPAPEPAPAAPSPLSTLRPGHPRLLVDASTWRTLRDRAVADPGFRSLLDAAIAAARARLDAPPPARELEGHRLLGVSRRVLADATWLPLAYKITGERAFLDAAERDLLAAASFSDWHPGHFLDVAEMTAAVALGYDWLHDDLSPATRSALLAAIADKGIRPGLDPDAATNWWQTRDMNWNQVCLGGLTLGALAIAEDEPALAGRALELLRTRHRHGLAAYEPDGIYPEGPGYWRYGTGYTVYTLAALRSALGADALMPGLDAFYAGARVQARLVAPSGLPFNYADCGRGREADPLLFWFAARLGEPGLLAGQRANYLPFAAPRSPAALSPCQIFALLDWQTPPADAHPAWTAWRGDGEVPLAVFRGPDTRAGAFYLAIKGGSPSDNHAHMDGGAFVFELDGVRWAHDLGMQEYHPLEQRDLRLFDGRPGGDRWKIFRYANLAHNTLAVDGAPHDPRGRVPLTGFTAPPDAASGVTADLASVLAPAVTRASRRFTPRPDARGFTVSDDLAGLRPGATVRWTLVTRAGITLGAASATLRDSGRELAVRVLRPPTVAVSVADARGPADFDEPAPGYRLLVIETPAPESGRVTLEIELGAP